METSRYLIGTVRQAGCLEKTTFFHVPEEALEELELAPPFVMMLCFEWLAEKMCGGCCFNPQKQSRLAEPDMVLETDYFWHEAKKEILN